MKTVFICLVLIVVLFHQSEGCKKPCQKRVHRHHIWKEAVKRRQDKRSETIKQFNERRHLHHGIRHFQVPRKCHYHKEIVQPKIAITNCSRTTSRKQHPWTRSNVRHHYYHFGGKRVSNKQIESMKKRWPQTNRRPYRFGHHHTVPVYKGVDDDIVVVVTEPEERQTESVPISPTTVTEFISSTTEVVQVALSSTTETPSSTTQDKSTTTEVIESTTPNENDGAIGKGQDSTTEAISTSPSKPPTQHTTVSTSSEEVEIVEVDTDDVDVGVLLMCLTKKEKAEAAAKKIDGSIVHYNATNPAKTATLDEVINSEDANGGDEESSAEEEGYINLIDVRSNFGD